MRRTATKLAAAAGAEAVRALAARELSVPVQVVAFLEEAIAQDMTVPFVARYRRHLTGGMTETQVEGAIERIIELRAVATARGKILADLKKRELWTAAIEKRLDAARTMAEIESIYHPFRVARKTNAAKGRDQGLDRYSNLVLQSADPLPQDFYRLSADQAKLVGAIIIEAFGQVSDAVNVVEEQFEPSAWINVSLASKGRKAAVKDMSAEEFESKRKHYAAYDGRRFPPGTIRGYQVLAINRGEALGFLKVDITSRAEGRIRAEALTKVTAEYPCLVERMKRQKERAKVVAWWNEAFDGHMVPHAERMLRSKLKAAAEKESIGVFRRNLRRELSQRPLRGHGLLAIDPGYLNGCKWAALSETGEVLATSKFMLPREFKGAAFGDKARQVAANASLDPLRALRNVILQHRLTRIVIGDGTASFEAQAYVSALVARDAEVRALGIQCCRTSEHGASVYSTSPAALQELPEMDSLFRSAVNIGRRVLDPLSELVKVPVQSLGVGMYQHDIPERKLIKGLNEATVSTVARFGVDANAASKFLLAKVPGLNEKLADAIVNFRSTVGTIGSREVLRRVPGVTPANYEKFIGFIRVRGGAEPLDDTSVHPETYALTRRLLKKAGVDPNKLPPWDVVSEKLRKAFDFKLLAEVQPNKLAAAAAAVDPTTIVHTGGGELPPVPPARVSEDEEATVVLPDAVAARIAREMSAPPEQVVQVLDALCAPRADPRDTVPYAGLFRDGGGTSEALREGDQLYGRVSNVVDFAAWIDIGVEDRAFGHIADFRDDRGAPVPRSLRALDLVAPCDVVKCVVLAPKQERRAQGGVNVSVVVPRDAVDGAAGGKTTAALPHVDSRREVADDGAEPPARRVRAEEAPPGRTPSPDAARVAEPSVDPAHTTKPTPPAGSPERRGGPTKRGRRPKRDRTAEPNEPTDGTKAHPHVVDA